LFDHQSIHHHRCQKRDASNDALEEEERRTRSTSTSLLLLKTKKLTNVKRPKILQSISVTVTLFCLSV